MLRARSRALGRYGASDGRGGSGGGGGGGAGCTSAVFGCELEPAKPFVPKLPCGFSKQHQTNTLEGFEAKGNCRVGKFTSESEKRLLRQRTCRDVTVLARAVHRDANRQPPDVRVAMGTLRLGAARCRCRGSPSRSRVVPELQPRAPLHDEVRRLLETVRGKQEHLSAQTRVSGVK